MMMMTTSKLQRYLSDKEKEMWYHFHNELLRGGGADLNFRVLFIAFRLDGMLIWFWHCCCQCDSDTKLDSGVLGNQNSILRKLICAV